MLPHISDSFPVEKYGTLNVLNENSIIAIHYNMENILDYSVDQLRLSRCGSIDSMCDLGIFVLDSFLKGTVFL